MKTPFVVFSPQIVAVLLRAIGFINHPQIAKPFIPCLVGKTLVLADALQSPVDELN